MPKKLPARPNLDHLRRQAKVLLTAVAAREPAALAALREHLPAAKKFTPDKLAAAADALRLADAQAVVARQSGFAGWPHLARHVEQLRALEGAWAFERLEIEGSTLPAAGLTASRILIDGDRFRTESPEASYEGIFNINVEADPHEIDIEFIAGPEAGHWNHGVFRLEGDRFDLCLDLNGKPRPVSFRTAPGSGHASETLRRISRTRPEAVDGGTPPAPSPSPAPAATAADRAAFAHAASPLLTRLQGEWAAVELVIDGSPLPAAMLSFGYRVTTENETKVVFGGRTMVHALMRLDETQAPVAVDYYRLDGAKCGALQLGLFEWRGAEACFCMADPGRPRPTAFASTPGSGCTLSRWKPKK